MSEPSIFRRRSLERLSRPERLDELLHVVKPKSWLVLCILFALLSLVIVWSFAGRLPELAEGTGIFVYPRHVVPVQSPGTGQLIELSVAVGDHVEEGQILARLELPDLQKALAQEKVRLSAFLDRESAISELAERHVRLQKDFIAEQIALIAERRRTLSAQAESLREKNENFNQVQRQQLERTRELSNEMGDALSAYLENHRTLREQGLSPVEAVLDAQRPYVENLLRLADLDVRMSQLELRELETEEAYLERLDQIADLDLRARDLALQRIRLDQELLEASLERQSREEQIRLSISRLENQLLTQGRVVADRTGRVLELTASIGEFVRSGMRIGSMEAEGPGRSLTIMSYFRVADGKKIREGMKARVSPVTVERQRHGSLIGTVRSVSAYPVTLEAVTNQVGNREVAGELMTGGRRIEVTIDLERNDDAPSGYLWTSSSGPDVEITAGTTAGVRVTTKQIPPAALVLPSLRSWFQVQ